MRIFMNGYNLFCKKKEGGNWGYELAEYIYVDAQVYGDGCFVTV